MAIPYDLQSYFAGAARQRHAYDQQRGSRFLNGLAGFGKSALGGFVNLAVSAFNHRLAEKSAKAQYERQLDFWNKQNAYNSPLAQRKRLEQAGLNPAVLGSQIAGSNSAGSLSSVPGNDVAQRGAVDHSSFLNSLQLLGQMESVGAGTDSMKRQIELSYADELIKNNQAYGIELDNREKHELLKWLSAEKRASLDSILAGTAHTNALTEGVNIDNSNKQRQYDDQHKLVVQQASSLLNDMINSRLSLDSQLKSADLENKLKELDIFSKSVDNELKDMGIDISGVQEYHAIPIRAFAAAKAFAKIHGVDIPPELEKRFKEGMEKSLTYMRASEKAAVYHEHFMRENLEKSTDPDYISAKDYLELEKWALEELKSCFTLLDFD